MWRSISAVLLGLIVVCGATGLSMAGDFSSLGYREDTVIQSDGRDECVGALVYNHDYSFENGYCWQYGVVAPPYYGAFAEGFDLGAATVECGVYWLTAIDWYPYRQTDVYVWNGGVHGPPAGVLCMIPGISDLQAGFWPSCLENDIEIGCCVGGDFAVGYWGDWPDAGCPYYCCADENGPGGHPWTCIARGIGYPSGWRHPNVVFSECVSMGIGVTVTEVPSPPESETWGALKTFFRGAGR